MYATIIVLSVLMALSAGALRLLTRLSNPTNPHPALIDPDHDGVWLAN